MRILVVIALFVVCAVNVVSQQPSTETKTQAIAAAFNKHKRTDRNSPTDAGVTTFGLGVVLRTPFERNGLTHEKLFYQLKQ